MASHESSVNFQNLIRDLADMYPYDISEVVIVELIANALDAHASCISINYNPQKKILVVQDNGRGMNESQFEEYHDFAAGLKTRGTGIGFAGLGAKVSFNIADKVITETRCKTLELGSDWYLISKKKLIWDDIRPSHLRESGTRVEVRFRSDITPRYESTESIIRLLKRHFLPLLDLMFLDMYQGVGIYSKSLQFIVNDKVVKPSRIKDDFSLEQVRELFPETKGKTFGYGIFGIASSEYPLAPDISGVLLCTYGKIIKADLFNQFPGSIGPRLFGIVEIPEFVKFLTTSKTDFKPMGKHREFERIYNPIRQEFKNWLNSIGVDTSEILGTNETIELEREIKKLIEYLPELKEFFGFWMRKDVLKEDEKGPIPFETQEGKDITFPIGDGTKGNGQALVDKGDEPGLTITEIKKGDEKASPISRKAPRGPKIAFVNAPSRLDLGWVEGNNIVINSGHPSYIKMFSNPKARRLHCLFSIASVIQRFLITESSKPDLMFIDRMMSTWGQK